jgi:D-serine deaminase-like pyridoxal phosphate-dependent protein
MENKALFNSQNRTVFAYTIENSGTNDTPFFAVYPAIIQRNIQRLISIFGNTNQIRPHVKTHKCPQVIKLLLDAGITKFKCATIAEAQMLALSGAKDILLAYQPVGPKVSRFLQLIVNYPESRFSCLVDNEVSAKLISEAALLLNVVASIWIDLNVGMNRTGIKPGYESKKLYALCSKLPGLQVVGLHAYDGHLTDPDSNKRLAQVKICFTAVTNFVDELIHSGFDPPKIVAGSTPTIQYYAKQPGVECSPGTFIYWDQHYQKCFPELGFENAALVVSRVVSNPDSMTACLDLGYKSIASEGPLNQRLNMPQLPHAQTVSQSEEHLLIQTGQTELQIGEIVYGLPYHIGRTCNLYEGCNVVEENQITGFWLHTARSR